MSKKVLVISASARKGGNSDVLCDEFIRGVKESGNEAEKIFLNAYHINYCTGCGVCNQTHQCVQKDDMEQLLAKMVEADVIVLATPVYFYSVNGQMKTFIDRTVPRYTEIANKDFYYIMTAADGDKATLERTVSTFRGFTQDCLPNPNERGILYATGVWQVGEVKTTKAMTQAYSMGLQA